MALDPREIFFQYLVRYNRNLKIWRSEWFEICSQRLIGAAISRQTDIDLETLETFEKIRRGRKRARARLWWELGETEWKSSKKMQWNVELKKDSNCIVRRQSGRDINRLRERRSSFWSPNRERIEPSKVKIFVRVV